MLSSLRLSLSSYVISCFAFVSNFLRTAPAVSKYSNLTVCARNEELYMNDCENILHRLNHLQTEIYYDCLEPL